MCSSDLIECCVRGPEVIELDQAGNVVSSFGGPGFHPLWPTALQTIIVDRDGNVWIGRQRDLMTMAHAADKTIVTVEKLYDGNLLADPALAAGTLPSFYVESIAIAERGSWPLPLPEHYAWDAEHLKEYVKLAATEEGFAKYLDRYVHEPVAA